MKLYKLTDEYGKTRNDTQWGPNISHSGTGEGGLCGPGWIHAYKSPLLAVLMNPIHAGFKNPRMWEAEGEIALRDGQLKCGCKTLTTIREIPLPAITTAMRVRFAILSSKEVFTCHAWNGWADKWLFDEDRTQSTASVARAVARAAAKDARAALWAAEARASESASARTVVRSISTRWSTAAAAAARAEADAAMAALWASESAVADAARAEAKVAAEAYRVSLEANVAGAAAAAVEWAAAAAARVGKRICPDGWMRMVLTYENH